MVLIKRKPELSHYQNAEHGAFHRSSLDICQRYASLIGEPPLIDRYSETVAQESSIFMWIRRSEFTQKKAEADQQRDRTYTGMLGTVRIGLKHFDQQMQDAAEHIYNLLKGYDDVPRMNYDAETAAIDNIVARLRSEAYVPAVQLLGLTSWINELDTLNAQFKTYAEDATQEEIDKPDITLRTARRETDASLRAIMARVDALATLNGPEPFVAFIDEFDTLVRHYNALIHEHYGRIHARTDISSALIDDIPPQPFIGKPVFVIPDVSLRTVASDETEKVITLVFSRDFNVTYKNNLQPGTATLTIQGIGQYKGEVITTFNIVRIDAE